MRLPLLVLALIGAVASRGPVLRVHEGYISIHDLSTPRIITTFVRSAPYTFEVFLDDTLQYDYMIEECTMNNDVIIGNYGCVQCGNCVQESIETESYNKPGAIKRTLVHFSAQSTNIAFHCRIRKIECSGCAERSCQRQNQIALSHFVSTSIEEMYPPMGYSGSGASFPIPLPPPIYPTPFFGGNFPIPPPPPPPAAAPAGVVGGAAASHGAGFWPWWIWLLILLLLLLLLCCLLILCLVAWFKRRQHRKTTTTTVAVVDTGKDCGVGTEKVAVQCKGTETEDTVKVQPAIVLGAHELAHHHSNSKSRHLHEADYGEGSVTAGGSYSVREGRVHEGYTRTMPYASNAAAYSSRERFDSRERGRYADRSSFRNFAYERDMGRVEPLDGFDEVETRERTYCLSDDEQEVIEKDVKRTHTTRFVQETRDYETETDERSRGDEHYHATYTHSLPV